MSYMLINMYVCFTSHFSPLTSHLSTLNSHLSHLTSHLSILISHLPPLTIHISHLNSQLSPLTTRNSPSWLLPRVLISGPPVHRLRWPALTSSAPPLVALSALAAVGWLAVGVPSTGSWWWWWGASIGKDRAELKRGTLYCTSGSYSNWCRWNMVISQDRRIPKWIFFIFWCILRFGNVL